MIDYLDRNYHATLECMILLKDRFEIFAFPIKSTKDFDLIGVQREVCSKIKVICTEMKQKSGAYVANLLKSGGYDHRKEKKASFDPASCDYVFVWTPQERYLIPSKEIFQKKSITLSMFGEFII